MPHALRHALRSLRKSPLFAAVAVLSLGLALALNTTMFALVDSVLHPYVPYADPQGLVTIRLRGGDGRRPLPVSDQLRAVREGMRSYAALATYRGWYTAVELRRGVMQDFSVAGVSPNFFDVVGVRPVLGRALGPSDSADGGAAGAAVISHALWRGVFDGADVVGAGTTLLIGGRGFTIVGVMPPGMHLGGSIWVPGAAVSAEASVGGVDFGSAPVLRLKPGVTREAAQAEAALIAQRLTAEFSSAERPYAARVEDAAPRPRKVQSFYKLLMGTVTAVLLIACANLATMMLARGMARRRETAVRMALGAGRGAIMREVLAECALLAAAGGVLGALLTVWALFVLVNRATRYVPQLGDLAPVPSWRVFAFAFGVAAVTMLLAGLIPARRAAATDPAEPMKEGSGNTTGRVRDRYNPLVMFEVALSTALLMSAALLIIGVFQTSAFRFRYDARKIITFEHNLDWQRGRNDLPPERFWDELAARARRLPGVRFAGLRRRESPAGPVVMGEAGKSGEHWINLRWYQAVSHDYLRAMGIPILQGRDFEPGDREAAASAGGLVIVDEDAARRLWPDLANPVGRMIKLGEAKSNRPWLRVVGVARSTEDGPRDDPYLAPEPMIYVLYARDTSTRRELVVRAAEDQTSQSSLVVELRREIQTLAPNLRWARVTPALAGFDARLSYTRFLASLFSGFGAFALVLSSVGLYGVVAYTVNRRLREFAVRIALGARRRHVVRIVVHDAAVMALAGVGVGAFVALATAPLVGTDPYRTPYTGVMALVAAEAVLLLSALLACVGPLRRATRADPVEILRAT